MDFPAGTFDLFVLSPEEFTAARDRLAKELKQDGDGEAAAAVKALKKPSVAAYALNLVARKHAYLVDRLLDADERLRRASSRSEMEGAKSDRQQSISAIVSQAAALLGEQDRPVTAQVKERLTQTLLAVGTDDVTRLNLKAGTLLKEAAPGGFGLGDAVPAFEEEPAETAEEQARANDKRAKKLRAEAEAKLAEAQTIRLRSERARRESEELAEASANARKRSEDLAAAAATAEREGRAKLAEVEELGG